MKQRRSVLITVLPFVILFVAMVCFLVVFRELPNVIGVHFGPDGKFDVYDSKMLGFYPFVAGFGIMSIFLLLGKITAKVKIGIRVTQKGEHILRILLRIYCHFFIWILSLFFTRWTYSVITQTPNNLLFLKIISFLFIISIPSMIIIFIVVIIRYKA